MSVDKSWAYINEFGPGRITAWEISQERAERGGKPLGKPYWSNSFWFHQSGVIAIELYRHEQSFCLTGEFPLAHGAYLHHLVTGVQ